ncbi:ISAs1 family transposase [Synechococcus elongatus IITB7]|uniref:ISAs1 family transposase n=1 Tax=Synechococcus elongatus TaxID=32046 RepID=UPI0030CAC04D
MLTLKRNQPVLFDFLRLQFQSPTLEPVAAAQQQETAHGRKSHWHLNALAAPAWLSKQWPGLSWLIEVRYQGCRGGHCSQQSHLFLTSLRTNGKTLLQLIRNRWSIENSWHWPRDVVMAEDRHRYRERNGVQILAALRTIAMNLLRLKGFQSLTQGRDALAHDLHALLNLS